MLWRTNILLRHHQFIETILILATGTITDTRILEYSFGLIRVTCVSFEVVSSHSPVPCACATFSIMEGVDVSDK